MKIFQAIQENFAVAGIHPKLASQSYPLNGRIFIGFLLIILSLTSMLMYIFNDAQTIPEYAQSIYMCSIGIIVFNAVLIILFNVKKLFNLIDCCEDLANTCKCE